MGKMLKHEHDKRQAGSVAEHFELSHEAKWNAPSLEQVYWKNPNAQRGDIARCSYHTGGIPEEVKYTEGN